MSQYPMGGGMVGVANEALNPTSQPAPMGQSMISPELAAAMMKRMRAAPTRSTTATKGGMQSALGGGAPHPSGLNDGFLKE